MNEINWDDLDFGFDKTGQDELDDYLRYDETPINFPSTGITNYGDYDPPSTGIGGSGTSYTVNPDGTITTNDGTGGGYGTGSTSEPNSGITDAINRLFGTNKSGLELAKIAAVLGGGLAGGLGAFSPKTQRVGYQGSIPKYDAVRNMVSAPPAGSRPGAGGVNYGGDVSYVPRGSASMGGGLASISDAMVRNPPSSDVDVFRAPMAPNNGVITETDVPETDFTMAKNLVGDGKPTPELSRGIAGNIGALGGSLGQMLKAINTPAAPREYDYPRPITGAMSPRDSRMAYEQMFAKGGNVPRYLQGETDGMADKIPARIGEDQPAALSHGEFVVPADVVSHLGNGNSDAGAKKLYSMMDKIRQARTGTKKQGKKINPDSFMPGGLASAYANGGSVKRYQTGGALPAGVTGSEQTLASWTGDYVPNMLGKAEALANAPYQQYGGPLSAGASSLQNQAFQAAGNLSVPSSVGQATQTAGDIASKAQGISYDPTKFENQFKAPELSAATQFTNQFKAPDPYQSTAFKSGTFGQEQAQQYMNPYLQASLNPQLEEARRQSNISEQANKAAMTKAGAFGGGRSAILTAENQRNLGTNLAGITGKGYDTAYQNAMSQFNADQARNMQAQQASEQSKQFGATQGMTAADMMAKYGMSAQQAQEAARQFNQGQSMTAAQQAAQYGQAAQQASEQSKQFGADLGLKGLQTGLQAAQTQGNLGISSGQLGLAQLQQQAALGATQRGIEAEGIAADKAAFEQARENPYKMLQFQQSMLQGLPIQATNYSLPEQDWLTKAAGGATTVNKLLETLGLGGSGSPKK